MNQPVPAAQAAPLFNPLSPEFIRDPYPYYRRLRATDPVHRSPLGFFVATRHADVNFVLREKSFAKDFVGRMTRRFGSEILDEPRAIEVMAVVRELVRECCHMLLLLRAW